jgi:hypothetical protein
LYIPFEKKVKKDEKDLVDDEISTINIDTAFAGNSSSTRKASMICFTKALNGG